MLTRRAARPRRRPRYFDALETLEPRTLLSVVIGPTGRTATYTDVDGDLVTVAVSRGTLTAANFQTAPSGLGDQLQEINLSNGGFDGADLSVSVKEVAGGDGLANIFSIDSAGHDLRNVSIPGNLGFIQIGNGVGTAIKSLAVQSMGDPGTESDIDGSLGSLFVKGDLQGTTLAVAATGPNGAESASIGLLSIGGSLIGEGDYSGEIYVSDGNIGRIAIGGGIDGGAGVSSAAISASGTIAKVTVKGYLVGGSGDESAEIFAGLKMGPVSILGGVMGGGGTQSAATICRQGPIKSFSIGGSVVGGSGSQSGELYAGAGVGQMSIGGSLVGGNGDFSAEICSVGPMGLVEIGGDVVGGDGENSAEICSYNGTLSGNFTIAGVSIGGSLFGGGGDTSGRIFAENDLGPVTIKGSVVGDIGEDSAGITAFTGKLASVSVGGSLTGGPGDESGQIYANQALGTVSIGGNLTGGDGQYSAEIGPIRGKFTSLAIGGSIVGGSGDESAEIYAGDALGSFSVGGSITGGGGQFSAEVYCKGPIGVVSIAGNLAGGDGDDSGEIYTSNGTIAGTCTIARIAIGGSVVGGSGNYSGRIFAKGDIGPVTIKGDIAGNAGASSGAIASNANIAEISVGGSDTGGSGDHSAEITTQGISFFGLGGSLLGGGGFGSGSLQASSDQQISRISIGGSVVGGSGGGSGEITTYGNVGIFTLAGDLNGGPNGTGGVDFFDSLLRQGTIGGALIDAALDVGGFDSISIGGNVQDSLVISSTGKDLNIKGSILSTGTGPFAATISASFLGKLHVYGSVLGSVNGTVAAFSTIILSGSEPLRGGKLANDPNLGMAANSIAIGGDIDLADILAGYFQSDAPLNANARIGTITIGGNCTAANIVAGAQNAASDDASFGDTNDAVIPNTLKTTPLSAIASITINGTVGGTDSATNAADHFGFVAQQIGALTVHGSKIALAQGPSNDDIPLGSTGDFNVHEI